MTADEVVAFIEESFGAYQQRLAAPSWKWDQPKLQAAVTDLARHELIRAGDEGRYTLAPLGRLAGESGTHVASIIRLVDALRLSSVGLDDPTLITLAQITTELDDVYLPLNRRSKNKEPQRWIGGLQQQGVPTRLLQIDAYEQTTVTLRAKKAAACLLWMSGRSRQEIETQLMQHMRERVAAGAVNQVRSRTSDLLPVVVSVAEILRDVDLSDRQADLMIRLELGVPDDLLSLARVCRGLLTRADYLRLRDAGVVTPDALAETKLDDLAGQLGSNKAKAKRLLNFIRDAQKVA